MSEQQPAGFAGPEKVYVHLDRTYFTPGETIWMKGYVENALPAAETSRFLYVELLDGRSGEAVRRVKLRYGEDSFAGHLDLPEELPGGPYVLRAYTRWQLNWPEERMYHVPVAVYDGTETEAPASDGRIDVSFYPEGGRCFSGESASVGFKAMASDGQSVPLNGKVYDDTGVLVCDARTEHVGMGLLVFTPEAGRRYRLVDEAGGQAWDLPAVATSGATLQVRRVGDHFVVKVLNRSGGPASLQLCSAGRLLPLGEIREGTRSLRVPVSFTGLQKFRLVDAKGRILSERAVYVEDPSAVASLAVNCKEPDYGARRRWRIRLALPEGLSADSAEVSVSLVRRAFRPYQQESNLTAYMLLGSEIRGYIEQPDYYFDPAVPAATRLSHLDLLLLIQGWTYYDEPSGPQTVRYPKEQVQSLRGRVRSVFGARPRNFVLAVIAPALSYSQVVSARRGQRFTADSLDFPDSTLFLVHIDNAGEVKRYYPELEEDFAPAMTGPLQSRLVPGRVRPAASDRQDAFQPGDLVRDTIATAVIQDVAPRIRTPFGTSDIPNIKKREELSLYDNRNLLDYILMKNPSLHLQGDELINLKTGYVNKNGEAYDKVSLFVDGFQTTWDLAEMIMLSDVEKLSVTTTMNSDAFLARSYGGIVLVELRDGTQSASFRQQSNSIVATPLGWQQPRAFYNSVHDRRRSLSLPDRRNTIYWNPAVRIGASAPADISVMTEDRADGPYYLRIEGRTSDGRWISLSRTLDN